MTESIALFDTLLPSFVGGATTKEELQEPKGYQRAVALDFCPWVIFNTHKQKKDNPYKRWLNCLIFDIDYKISIDDAYRLIERETGVKPTWICPTTKGVHIGFVLGKWIRHSSPKALGFARKIKIAVTKVLKADPYASHRLWGFYRNPLLHNSYIDVNAKCELSDFYHIIQKQQSVKKQFKNDVRKRKEKEKRFNYTVGNRNEYLWSFGMRHTQNIQEGKDFEYVYNFLKEESDRYSVEALPEAEILKTAASIVEYNVKGKNFISNGGKSKSVKVGVMGFKEIDKSLDYDEYAEEIKRRQRASAEYTKGKDMTRTQRALANTEKRKTKARNTVLSFITGLLKEEYRKKDGSWNYSKIARDGSMSLNTVKKYIKEYEEDRFIL